MSQSQNQGHQNIPDTYTSAQHKLLEGAIYFLIGFHLLYIGVIILLMVYYYRMVLKPRNELCDMFTRILHSPWVPFNSKNTSEYRSTLSTRHLKQLDSKLAKSSDLTSAVEAYQQLLKYAREMDRPDKAGIKYKDRATMECHRSRVFALAAATRTLLRNIHPASDTYELKTKLHINQKLTKNKAYNKLNEERSEFDPHIRTDFKGSLHTAPKEKSMEKSKLVDERTTRSSENMLEQGAADHSKTLRANPASDIQPLIQQQPTPGSQKGNYQQEQET